MILSVLTNATWLGTDNTLGGRSCCKYIKLENAQKKKKTECVYVERGRVVVGTNTPKIIQIRVSFSLSMGLAPIGFNQPLVGNASVLTMPTCHYP